MDRRLASAIGGGVRRYIGMLRFGASLDGRASTFPSMLGALERDAVTLLTPPGSAAQAALAYPILAWGWASVA